MTSQSVCFAIVCDRCAKRSLDCATRETAADACRRDGWLLLTGDLAFCRICDTARTAELKRQMKEAGL